MFELRCRIANWLFWLAIKAMPRGRSKELLVACLADFSATIVLDRRFHKVMKHDFGAWIPLAQETRVHDMWDGPCKCGSWHKDGR